MRLCVLLRLLWMGPVPVVRAEPTGPVPTKGPVPLGPLYQRMANDIQLGKPLVATVHVALCDNRVIWCGHGGMGDGDHPHRNLYWGAAAGLRAWFDRAKGWRRIHVDAGDGALVLERVVYRRRVQASTAWRRLGVRRSFDLLLVGLAYRGTRIDEAMTDFIKQVAGPVKKLAVIRLSDGRTVEYGGKGHLMGYAGHNRLMELTLLGDWHWPRLQRTQPMGFFVLACLSAPYFKNHLCDANTRGLLLTRSLMYPGAFTVDGLLRGIAAGEDQQRVYLRGVERYATAQRRPQRVIRAAFTHDAEPRYARAYGRCSQ